MNTDIVLVDVATKDLSKLALDWAVFCAVYPGMQPTIHVTDAGTHEMPSPLKPISLPRTVRLTYTGAYAIECNWNPSGDWECGGPLRDKYRVEVLECGDVVHAKLAGLTDSAGCGDTALIAICRAIVTSKLGYIVKVPACLVLP